MPLEIADVIQVQSEIRTGGVARKEFGRTLFLTTEGTLDGGGAGKVGVYARMADVVSAGFATNSEPYKAASVYFSQNPRPRNLLVGRWAKTAVSTTIVGGTPGTVAALRAITNGTFTVGGESFAGINLSSHATFSAIAGAIQAALQASSDARFSGALVTYNNSVFNMSLPSGGDIGGAFVPSGTGTDLAVPLGLAASAGAKYKQGSAVETISEALDVIEEINPDFYFITVEAGTSADHIVSVATWAAARRYMFFAPTSEAAALSATDTTSIAARIEDLGYGRAPVVFSRNADYLALSIAAGMSSIDFSLANSLRTAKFLTAPGITSSDLSVAEKMVLDSKRANYYTSFSGDAIVAEGVTAKPGVWIDTQYWLDWIVNSLETELWNLLRSRTVPQNSFGIQRVRETCISVLEQGVRNGGISPGVVSPDFINEIRQTIGGDFDGNLSNGYLVSIGRLSQQLRTDREARKIPSVKIWIRGSGFVHSANVSLVYEG